MLMIQSEAGTKTHSERTSPKKHLEPGTKENSSRTWACCALSLSLSVSWAEGSGASWYCPLGGPCSAVAREVTGSAGGLELCPGGPSLTRSCLQ